MFITMQVIACTTLQMVYFIDYIFYLFTCAYSIFPINSTAQYIFVKLI